MIKAVSFDLWFTLIWETKEDEELYLRMRLDSIRKSLEELGVEVSFEKIMRAYVETKDFRMLMPPDDLLRILFTKLGLILEENAFSRVVERYVESTDGFVPRLNEEAPEVLRELKRNGLKLALVSNTSFSTRSIRGILRNVGLDLFDVIISSCDVGMIKPQRGIFELLKEALGLRGDEIIHVGDSCYHDVIGALQAGLKSAHYPKLALLRRNEAEDCEGPFLKIDSLRQLLEIVRS
mgnify:CR=1 FL=1